MDDHTYTLDPHQRVLLETLQTEDLPNYHFNQTEQWELLDLMRLGLVARYVDEGGYFVWTLTNIGEQTLER